MERKRIIKIGVQDSKLARFSSVDVSHKVLKRYLSQKKNADGRILLALHDYLVKYTKIFDEAILLFTSEKNLIFRNGTMQGISAMINRAEIDITSQTVIIKQSNLKIADFAYPYHLNSATFVIRKQEYRPMILGIFQTFSWQLWIAILLSLIAMSLVYYVNSNKQSSLSKLFLHALAVLLRQNSLLNTSKMSERLFFYSWVIGTMFICLAYDSVILSFLTFPPLNQIKDASQLAKAIINRDYHCTIHPESGFADLLENSYQEDLRVIGKDIKNNNLNYSDYPKLLIKGNISQGIAVIIDADLSDLLTIGCNFVSEDRFLESIAAIMVRKHFCCKDVIESFVHKLLASGLYSKYHSDKSFYSRLPSLLKYSKKDTRKRRLTVIDVAPAFLILISGYFLSSLVLIGEKLRNRVKNRISKKKSQT